MNRNIGIFPAFEAGAWLLCCYFESINRHHCSRIPVSVSVFLLCEDQHGCNLGTSTLRHPRYEGYTLYSIQLLMLLLFLTFSVLVANPKKLLYTVANPTRGLLNREKRTKEKKSGGTPPPPPPPPRPRRCSFGESKIENHATHLHA